MHRQHQRRRRAGLAENAEDPGRIARSRADAAERRRYGQHQQSFSRKVVEILERKACIAIMQDGTFGEARSQ
jgi:hypothetical protein